MGPVRSSLLKKIGSHLQGIYSSEPAGQVPQKVNVKACTDNKSSSVIVGICTTGPFALKTVNYEV